MLSSFYRLKQISVARFVKIRQVLIPTVEISQEEGKRETIGRLNLLEVENGSR